MPVHLMGCCLSKSEKDQRTDREIASKLLKGSSVIINDRWQVIKQIGKGGYGKVYQVLDLKDTFEGSSTSMYAMKIEKLRHKVKYGRLPQEAFVLELLTKNASGCARHVVQVFDKGMIENRAEKKKSFQFMVMTLLGPSLAELRKILPRRRFSSLTTAMIGVQLIESLEELHSIGYIHRDIKPHNFMIGLYDQIRTIFLIDFGMARKITDEKGELMKIRLDDVPFRGTSRYCAPSVHEHQEYGRHHDLWSVLHTLVECRKGTLPWQGITGDRRATYRMKKKLVAERWLHDVEPEYLTFYENLTSLHYDIKPDYEFLKNLLISIVDREHGNDLGAPLFDWEIGSKIYHSLPRIRLLKLFRHNLLGQN